MFFAGVVVDRFFYPFSNQFLWFCSGKLQFGMHSGGTTGRRKEKTGTGGGGAGIRVWASNWQPVTTADWPQVKDCLNWWLVPSKPNLAVFSFKLMDFDCFWEVGCFDPYAKRSKSLRMLYERWRRKNQHIMLFRSFNIDLWCMNGDPPHSLKVTLLICHQHMLLEVLPWCGLDMSWLIRPDAVGSDWDALDSEHCVFWGRTRRSTKDCGRGAPTEGWNQNPKDCGYCRHLNQQRQPIKQLSHSTNSTRNTIILIYTRNSS